MAKRVVTLDIDSTSVRLLELVGKRVRRWATAPLEPGLVENGVVVDPEAVGARIRELIRSSRIRGRNIITSVGGAFSISRILTLPPTTDEDLEYQVRQAAKEVLPVPLEELYLTWQPIISTGLEQEVLLLAIPRSVVNYHLAALHAGGVKVNVVNLKPLALVAVCAQTDALVVNLEPISIDIAVVVNGVPQILHTTSFSKNNLAPQEEVDRTALTVSRTVEFYNTRHPLLPLEPDAPILLAGQQATDPLLVQQLEAHTGRTVSLLAPPVECPSHFPLAQYAVNIGLAIRPGAVEGLPTGTVPFTVNILPPRERRYPQRVCKQSGGVPSL